MEPFRRNRLVTIPRVSTLVADVIIAETGGIMSRFPAAGHLASWAGTCPGSNESAGRVKSTQTRPGNPYLKGALGIAAMLAARSKNTYLSVAHISDHPGGATIHAPACPGFPGALLGSCER